MPTTYIAGFDGSAASRAAVELAARLAAPRAAHLVAVNVYAPAAGAYWTPVEAMRFDDVQAEYRREAEELLETLEPPGVEKRAVEAASPARGLHELAVELDAGLIAVGVTDRGPLGRLAPGSVASHLLHGSPCPVLVAPEGADASAIRAVGVAYDGSEGALAALHSARELAREHDARLVVIGAHQPSPVPVKMGYPGLPDVAAEDRQQFETMLERGAAGVDAEYRMIMGSPGHTIAQASGDFDLLVTGSRGYGPARSVLLGSVSRHLVDHAHCPVLVVPRPA